MWKHFIADYLSFSKKERTGILVLVSMIGFFMGLPFLYPFFIKPQPTNAKVFEKAIASLSIKQTGDRKKISTHTSEDNFQQSVNQFNSNPPIKGKLFYFDPNTASTDDWKSLGVRDKTIATIQHYLSKGGRFYKKEDIGKIWGLQPKEVERLTPYIQIQSSQIIQFSEEKDFKKNHLEQQFTLFLQLISIGLIPLHSSRYQVLAANYPSALLILGISLVGFMRWIK